MARKNEPWYRSGKRCWYVWHAGKLLRLHQDKIEAYRLWHQLLAGTPPSPTRTATSPPSPPRPTLTVGELIDAYLSDAKLRLKPSTFVSKRKVLLRLKGDHEQDPATSLTPPVITAWLAGQVTWGRSLRWLAASIVRSCCRWAVPALVESDPTVGLKLPGPLSRGADSLITQDQHERLLAAAPPAIRDTLLALHATGCRPCELCQVEARRFDPASGTWLLQQHKTAGTGRVRVVLLPPAVVTLCKTLAQRHPTGPLFRGCKDQPLTPDRLRNWVFKTRRRLGLGRVIAYGYRHGLATDALAAGVPDAQVAELLGHTGTTMLHRHYSHLTAKARTLRGALDLVRGQEGPEEMVGASFRATESGVPGRDQWHGQRSC
jgi:integrase